MVADEHHHPLEHVAGLRQVWRVAGVSFGVDVFQRDGLTMRGGASRGNSMPIMGIGSGAVDTTYPSDSRGAWHATFSAQ